VLPANVGETVNLYPLLISKAVGVVTENVVLCVLKSKSALKFIVFGSPQLELSAMSVSTSPSVLHKLAQSI